MKRRWSSLETMPRASTARIRTLFSPSTAGMVSWKLPFNPPSLRLSVAGVKAPPFTATSTRSRPLSSAAVPRRVTVLATTRAAAVGVFSTTLGMRESVSKIRTLAVAGSPREAAPVTSERRRLKRSCGSLSPSLLRPMSMTRSASPSAKVMISSNAP